MSFAVGSLCDRGQARSLLWHISPFPSGTGTADQVQGPGTGLVFLEPSGLSAWKEGGLHPGPVEDVSCVKRTLGVDRESGQ